MRRVARNETMRPQMVRRNKNSFTKEISVKGFSVNSKWLLTGDKKRKLFTSNPRFPKTWVQHEQKNKLVLTKTFYGMLPGNKWNSIEKVSNIFCSE